jgi:hypothetical protein
MKNNIQNLYVAMAISAAGAIFAVNSVAQNESASGLAERSAIVVAGKVVRVNATLDPMQAASPQTIVIAVSRMYAGAEIAGDQKGRMATVVLSRPSTALKVGTEGLFFGNPRFLGTTLTIADEGEFFADAARIASANLETSVQARRDQPLRERIASASSVFRGRVESERALAARSDQAGKLLEPPSEHDPEWHVASVRVLTALQSSEQGALVNVIFPASRDVVWFNAPKLRVGQEAIFITHKPDKDDTQLMRAPGVADFLEKQSADVVSEPFDTVPPSEEARVRALLGR